MKSNKKTAPSFSSYLRLKRSSQILFFLLASLSFILVWLCSNVLENNPIIGWWINLAEPLSTILIIILAIFIWINDQHEEWKKSLPKRLDVHYKIKKSEMGNLNDYEEFCTVLNAPLSGESDIRQWGISLAKNVLNDQSINVDFSGFFIAPSHYERKDKIMKYQLTIYLKKEIIGVTKGDIMDFDEMGKFLGHNSSNKGELFINYSNHPYTNWSEKQKEAVKTDLNCSKVEDIPFLNVDPKSDARKLNELANIELQKIRDKQPKVVHIAGEPTLCWLLVSKLKFRNIKCVASTTERKVTEVNNVKTSEFNFIQFREYL